MAVLKLMSGGNSGQIIPLAGERVVFGRHPTCQVVLDNAAVSRHHAQVLESHGTYYLEDLRSRNGTLLNDIPIRGRIELHDGDEIKLCDYAFEFLSESTSSPPSSVQLATPKKGGTTRTMDAIGAMEGSSVSDLGAAPDPAVPVPDGSSILGRLPSDHVPTVRLNVRPEVKLKAIVDLSSELARVLKIGDVLPSILTALFRIFPQADHGFVLLRDAETDRLVIRAAKSRRADDDENIPLSMTIVQQALESFQSILSADATRDRRFSASESLTDLEIRSVMCSPLIDPMRKGLGVIQVSTRDLGQPFTTDDLELLASVTSQCSLAVQNAALHETLVAQRDLERELEFATQVQLGFLPSERPKLDDYEFADYYEPAHSVGGDYFDYIPLPNGNVAITVGDVAGKGVPAALLMARLHASARYHLLSALSASEAIASLNAEIVTTGLGFRFITLALAVIVPHKHELRLANAGHLPPLLRRANGVVESIGQKESGMPLGISASQAFQETVIALQPGDTLVFFTDGITEAMNATNEIYGRNRLETTMATGPAAVSELVPAIVEDVERFYGERAQRDDLCVVGFRRLSPKPVASDGRPPDTTEITDDNVHA